MRSLLKQAFLDMYQEDMPFCFLMPADRRIYEPFVLCMYLTSRCGNKIKRLAGTGRDRRVGKGNRRLDE